MIIKKSELIYYDCIFAREHHMSAPGMEVWSKAHKFFGNNTCLIDRSSSVTMPMSCRVLPWLAIPEIKKAENFDKLSLSLASDIWNRAIKHNQEIAVMWSGGIDSTLALSCMLMTAPSQELHRLTVLMSRESLIEYPWYYHNVIKNKLRVGASDAWHLWIRKDCIFLTGEGGDQLVNGGFYKLRRFVEEHNKPTSNVDFTIKLLSLASLHPELTYERIVEPIQKSAPCSLEFSMSPIWWSVFCLDWQSRYLTLMNNLPAHQRFLIDETYLKDNWVMFFQDPGMQNWAMQNQKSFLDSGLDNKKVFKDVIFQYTKDNIYKDNKTKKSSMMNVKRSRPSNAGITDDFKFVDRVDECYLNSTNSFI